MPNPNIIPAFVYRDAAEMIEWLCRAFGFEKHAVYQEPDGKVAHAELTYEGGMIMLGSENDREFGKHVKSPLSLSGLSTSGPYVIVADADAHYARAKAAGAEIVVDIKDESYGGRGYTCRDPEGTLWSFGTYDPWKPAHPAQS